MTDREKFYAEIKAYNESIKQYKEKVQELVGSGRGFMAIADIARELDALCEHMGRKRVIDAGKIGLIRLKAQYCLKSGGDYKAVLEDILALTEDEE